jgi:predicted DNA repair protein MutK
VKVCRRRSAVNVVDVAAAAIADVAAGREAALAVAGSGLVVDDTAIPKGSRWVVWRTS